MPIDLRNRDGDDMKAIKLRIQNMIQGKFEIKDGTNGSIGFESAMELFRRSQRYEKRKNEQKITSNVVTKRQLFEIIDKMEKARDNASNVIKEIMENNNRLEEGMRIMVNQNKKLIEKVELFREDNFKFASYAAKHQKCNCHHGKDFKDLIENNVSIKEIEKENEKERKSTEEDDEDDMNSTSKKSKMDSRKRKRKANENALQPESKRKRKNKETSDMTRKRKANENAPQPESKRKRKNKETSDMTRKRKVNENAPQSESKRNRSSKSNDSNDMFMTTKDGETRIGIKMRYKRSNHKKSTPEPLTYFEKAQMAVAKHNLPFRISHETPADGNCFYSALFEILRYEPNLIERAMKKVNNGKDEIDAKVIKSMIMEAMRRDSKNVVCECPESRTNKKCQNGKEHIAYLQNDGVWADEMVFKYASDLFGVMIHLITEEGKIHGSFTWCDAHEKDIYMLYFPNSHFQSLEEHDQEHQILETNDQLEDYEDELQARMRDLPLE